MLRFTVGKAGAVYDAIADKPPAAPGVSCAEHVRNLVMENLDGSLFAASDEISWATASDVIEESDAELERLFYRVECACSYMKAFPNRPPIYAFRAAELINVEDYPMIFSSPTDRAKYREGKFADLSDRPRRPKEIVKFPSRQVNGQWYYKRDGSWYRYHPDPAHHWHNEPVDEPDVPKDLDIPF